MAIHLVNQSIISVRNMKRTWYVLRTVFASFLAEFRTSLFDFSKRSHYHRRRTIRIHPDYDSEILIWNACCVCHFSYSDRVITPNNNCNLITFCRKTFSFKHFDLKFLCVNSLSYSSPSKNCQSDTSPAKLVNIHDVITQSNRDNSVKTNQSER